MEIYDIVLSQFKFIARSHFTIERVKTNGRKIWR